MERNKILYIVMKIDEEAGGNQTVGKELYRGKSQKTAEATARMLGPTLLTEFTFYPETSLNGFHVVTDRYEQDTVMSSKKRRINRTPLSSSTFDKRDLGILESLSKE